MKLKNCCENVKQKLSKAEETEMNFQHEDIVFKCTITREEFENLIADLLEKCEACMNTALTDAKLSKEEIDEVLLVGGSTNIPKVIELVQNFFQGQ